MKLGGPGTWRSAAGPSLIALCGLAMAAWTWGTWPDPLVDFGRELYVPWRLAEGEVLFRDIAWFNGPLSPHFNALLFRVFGVGLSTLVWANLGLLALAVALLWRLCTRMADRLSATVACLLFLLVFAFGQLVGIANYNWVCPYSHEATHGVLLGIGALVCLDQWRGGPTVHGERAAPDERDGGGLPWVAGAGLLCGLAFLTKAETFLAAAAGCVTALGAGLWCSRSTRIGSTLSLFAAALVVPIALAFALLSTNLPASEAWRGVLGSWPSVLGGEVSELAFYRAGMGLDVPGQRLPELALAALAWGLALGAAAALGWKVRARGLAGLSLGLVLPLVGVLWLMRAHLATLPTLRPLPLFMAIGAGLALVRVVRARGDGGDRRDGTTLACAIFALALLAKMILHARAENYGFTLALPATMFFAVWSVGRIPAWIDARGANGDLLRGVACVLLLFGAGAKVHTTARFLEHKTTLVGEGPDSFRADLRGGFVNETLAVLSDSGASSLVVVPEGVMINYLARVPNPTPYVNFMPPEELLFGQAAWIEALEAAPPQVLVLAHKDTTEYGFPLFGIDYAAELGAWIDARYRVVTQFGQPPLKPGTRFGIRILALGKER